MGKGGRCGLAGGSSKRKPQRHLFTFVPPSSPKFSKVTRLPIVAINMAANMGEFHERVYEVRLLFIEREGRKWKVVSSS